MRKSRQTIAPNQDALKRFGAPKIQENKFKDLPVMNNKRLQKFSEVFRDDNGNTIERRCFFLFAGTDLNKGRAFNLDLTFKQKDDPNIPRNIKVEITVDDVTSEQCSDVILSLSHIVPDFRIFFRYDDLYPKPPSLDI